MGEENEIPNSMVYNTQYDESCWKDLRDWVGLMRNVIERANAAGLDLPPTPHGAQKEAHTSYQIKGLYNTRCEQVGDHHTYLNGGDWVLMEWAQT